MKIQSFEAMCSLLRKPTGKTFILKLLFFVLALGFFPQKGEAQTDVYVSYQAFYEDLSPYGQWVDDAQYGSVWVPNIEDDFRPYFTNGHWAMTEYGNTWVSGYPWGWACFHYGRWVYTGFYGWVWVPGSEWGPGWVAWRWGMGYCGWAPLYPGADWSGGADFICPEDWWIFMHPRHLYKPRYVNIWREDFLRGPRYTHKILERANFVSNKFEGGPRAYFAGPRAADVKQVTHQDVPVYHIEQASTRVPGTIVGNTLYMYHPQRVDATVRGETPVKPANIIPAPQPIGKPQEVQRNWNQPHEFRTGTQSQSPGWNKPFMRNDPPYSPTPSQNRPPSQSQPTQQQPRSVPAPAPRANPAPAPRSQPAPRPSAPAHR